MPKIQVNVTAAVNKAGIRRERLNGRDHFVIASKTLPFDVIMNRGLYPRAQIEAHYKKLEGTLAPLGHPEIDGQFISAFSPEGINGHHVGAWNRTAKIVGNRVDVEKWLDIEVAKSSEKGQRLLTRLEALESGADTKPIHTSVALWVDRELAPNAEGYDWVANIQKIDHDAILLDEEGAATPEQGVGLMVNADTAEPVPAKATVLVGQSYRELEQILSRAVKEALATGDEDYAWVADFTPDQVVVVLNGGETKVYSYTIDGNKATISQTGVAVEEQKGWVAVAANRLIKATNKFFNPQARLALNQEAEMPMTPEEKSELLAEVGTAIDQKMQPLADAVAELKTLITDSADKEAKQAEAETNAKRKIVSAKFGDIVANSLTGAALDDMVKASGVAAVLAPNSAPVAAPTMGVPDFNTYEGA